jgi:fatty-acyl-CoA synthase
MASEFPSKAQNLVEPLLRFTAERPNDVALWFVAHGQTTPVTYRELFEGACRYASALQAKGIKSRDVVILLLDHSIDQYCGFIGAMLLGAVPSFMPPLTSKQKPGLYWAAHATLFARIQPTALIISAVRAKELRRFIPTADFAVLTVEECAKCMMALVRRESLALDGIAFLQHSSGTTQLKRGVELSHRAVLAQISAYSGVLEIVQTDCIASWLPLYHDMGLIACFIMPIVLGLPVVTINPFEWVGEPDILLKAVEQHRCTLTWMPNFAFNHLVRTRRPEVRYDLSSMRAWINCSEPCRAATFDRFVDCFADCGVTDDRLQVCYAMAETVFAVSQTDLARPVRRLRVDAACLSPSARVIERASNEKSVELLSCGEMLPGVEIAIIDEQSEALPELHVGEIAVSASFLFSAYHRLPDRTAAKLHDGIYRTGDLGFLWHDQLQVIGRVDDLIIVNGRNCFCHEIEDIVAFTPGVRPGRAVAFAIEDAGGGSQVAVVVCESELGDGRGTLDLKRMIKESVFTQCDLTIHEVLFVPPGWIIKTTSGKLSRAANRRKYLVMRQKRVKL